MIGKSETQVIAITEIQNIGKLVASIKAKGIPKCLRKKVLSYHLMQSLCGKYPLTCALIMCPVISDRQVYSLLKKYPNAKIELKIYQTYED